MSQYVPTWKIWLQKAHSDLKAAKLLLDQTGDDLIESSVYHSQQCAEKAIKGYLTFSKLRFGKTHHILELINILSKQDSAFAETLKPADKLTIYATAFRYPEEGKEPVPLNRETATNAYNLANWVLLEIQAKLQIGI